MKIFKPFLAVFVCCLAFIAMNADNNAEVGRTPIFRADYRVIPLPDAINGIKNTSFVLSQEKLINYPTGNRDMELNAMFLSQYIEDMTGMHLSIRPSRITKDRTDNITLLLDNEMQ